MSLVEGRDRVMKELCVTGALLTVLAVVLTPTLLTQAAERPLVEQGKTYAVVWSCINQVGCYGELLRVDVLRKDGWADVTDMTPSPRTPHGSGEQWTVHLSQAMGIRLHRPEGRAAN